MQRTLPDGGGHTFYNFAADGGPQARGWIEATGAYLDGGSGPSAFNATSGGVEGRADVAFAGGARLGGALEYESSRLAGGGGSASLSAVRASLYASQSVGALGFSAALTYAHGWDDTSRAAGVGVSVSSRGLDELTAAFQAASVAQAGPVQVTPAAGVLVTHAAASGFAEFNATDPTFAVTGASASGTFVSPFVSLAFSRPFTTAEGVAVTPDVMLGYRYDDAASGLSQTLQAADGTLFRNVRSGLYPNAFQAGASLTAHRGAWTGFVKYRATLAGGWTDQSLEAGLRLAF